MATVHVCQSFLEVQTRAGVKRLFDVAETVLPVEMGELLLFNLSNPLVPICKMRLINSCSQVVVRIRDNI